MTVENWVPFKALAWMAETATRDGRIIRTEALSVNQSDPFPLVTPGVIGAIVGKVICLEDSGLYAVWAEGLCDPRLVEEYALCLHAVDVEWDGVRLTEGRVAGFTVCEAASAPWEGCIIRAV